MSINVQPMHSIWCASLRFFPLPLYLYVYLPLNNYTRRLLRIKWIKFVRKSPTFYSIFLPSYPGYSN